jgi:hypothetical protein
MTVTVDLLATLVARLAGGDGAAGLTVSAAPVHLSVGEWLLVIAAVAVVCSVIGALAAIVLPLTGDEHGET